MDLNKLIIIFLFIIIIALIFFIAFFLYLYIKRKPVSFLGESGPQDTLNIPGVCYIHRDKYSSSICSICDEDICNECVKQIDKVNLCPAHLKTYIESRWVPITNQMTTAQTPEAGLYIYNFKKDIWDKENIPTYILNDYKINVDQDNIETYVQLFVKEENEELLKNRITQRPT